MITYLIVLVVMVALFWALESVVWWIAGNGWPTWFDRLLPHKPEPIIEPLPPVLCELELARMSRILQQVYDSDPQGRALRVTACTIAYDDALCECAASYGLPTTDERPLSPGQRLESETQLLALGARW